MDKLIEALAPVFAAGLGIQQLGEILSPLLDKISPNYKKVILGIVSLSLGMVLAYQFELQVIHLLSPSSTQHPKLDVMVTGIIISGGTEGINSILKFLKYKKEDAKNEAAIRTPDGAAAGAAATVPKPTATALDDMNRK